MGAGLRHRGPVADASAVRAGGDAPDPCAHLDRLAWRRLWLVGERFGTYRVRVDVPKPVALFLEVRAWRSGGDTKEMSFSLWAICLWIILAAVLAAIPSNDNHSRRAYFLIAIGVPLLGWVTYENGTWIGLVALIVGASFLRWPVIYLWRWMRRVVGS